MQKFLVINDEELFYVDEYVYQNGSVYRGQMKKRMAKNVKILEDSRDGYGV